MPAAPISDPARFEVAIALFDKANAEDPNHEVVDGTAHASALLYARRMTDQLQRFAPEASEALRLAVRCQHIRRWTIPREAFPDGVLGYKQWRSTLAQFHADTAGVLLREAGYDEDMVTRVQDLLKKRRLKRDPEVQTLEDVVCLVFLNHYFDDFARKHDDAKLIGILQKTWVKMSPEGREAALRLDLSPPLRALVDQALAAS